MQLLTPQDTSLPESVEAENWEAKALSTPRGLGSGRSCSTAPPADSQRLAEPPGTGALSLPEISSVTAQAAEPRVLVPASRTLMSAPAPPGGLRRTRSGCV